MYHPIFNGSHYDIGYKWGSSLRSKGTLLLDNIPFKITKKHMDFGQSCLDAYNKHFPEIVEEINGIADGQNCDVNSLYAILFSMYCIMPCTNCSCFAAKTPEGKTIFGRNSDFLTCIEKLYLNTIYRFKNQSYSFNGNTTAFVQMEDGINQHGLAVGLTAVAPGHIQAGINAGMLLRLFLEKCQDTTQVLEMLESLPVATSQTFIIADAQNRAVLIELSPKAMEVVELNHQNTFICSTNMFNTNKMQPYNNLPEDNWQAKERYETMVNFFTKPQNEPFSVDAAKQLLSGKHGFMCQYNRSTGKDTVWSVVYVPSESGIYRAEKNPGRTEFVLDTRKL